MKLTTYSNFTVSSSIPHNDRLTHALNGVSYIIPPFHLLLGSFLLKITISSNKTLTQSLNKRSVPLNINMAETELRSRLPPKREQLWR
jgi:hypothetical protein